MRVTDLKPYNMKKIIFFYLLCCLSICCFDIILIWLALDHCDIESPDFKFGFNVMVLANCAIYAPIFTISASILYYTKVNKAILSNKWYSVLYCILPFLCYKILDLFCIYCGIHIGYDLEYSIPIVFIIQNVIIILKHSVRNIYSRAL